MAFYLVLILLSLIVLFLHFYLNENRRAKLVNKIPGPPTLPIIGNGLQLNRTPDEFFKLFRKYAKDYYPIYRLWILNYALISVRHPDDIELVLKSNCYLRREFLSDFLKPWLKNSLVTVSGNDWYHKRKVMTPAFHINIRKEIMKLIVKQTDDCISKMRSQGSVFTIDLIPFYMKLTLNVICESVIGVALDDTEDQESATNYKNSFNEMLDIVEYRMIRPYLTNWVLPLLPDLNKKIKKSVYIMDKFVNKAIEQRRQYHKETNYEYLDQLQNNAEKLGEDISHDGTKKRLVMLDLLLAAERNNLIDQKDINGEVTTLIFGGRDTTGTAISFTILLLAEHKDIQEQARKEVEEVLSKRNGKLDFAALTELKYLERCIKEAMRLYPPGPLTPRYTTEDLQLKNYVIPKDTNVLVHIFDVHRDPDFWPEPEIFNPDRFLPDQVNKRHPYCYIPFSAGNRNCIGQRYAMMEMMCVIALTLYNFHLEQFDQINDMEFNVSPMLQPKRPIHARFIRINRS